MLHGIDSDSSIQLLSRVPGTIYIYRRYVHLPRRLLLDTCTSNEGNKQDKRHDTQKAKDKGGLQHVLPGIRTVLIEALFVLNFHFFRAFFFVPQRFHVFFLKMGMPSVNQIFRPLLVFRVGNIPGFLGKKRGKSGKKLFDKDGPNSTDERPSAF